MNFSGFEYYCETPDVGLSGKGKSYKNAIQYLCDFLKISTYSFFIKRFKNNKKQKI